jgi:hypothetical protein
MEQKIAIITGVVLVALVLFVWIVLPLFSKKERDFDNRVNKAKMGQQPDATGRIKEKQD